MTFPIIEYDERKHSRNIKIVEMRQEGETYRAIGEEVGLSKAQVRRVLMTMWYVNPCLRDSFKRPEVAYSSSRLRGSMARNYRWPDVPRETL